MSTTNNTNQGSLPTGEGKGGALICIIGPSGAGKDTAARILSELTGIPVLVSFTTRPMRPDEKQGREHVFVHACHARKDDMLAYTEYGGYEYWTTLSQIHGKAIYVIDEEGIRDLKQNHPDIHITTIYITASKIVRRQRGVTVERMQRDDLREQFPLDFYDYRIYNNKGKDDLMRKLIEITDRITNDDL